MGKLNQRVTEGVQNNTNYFDLDEMLKKNGIYEIPVEIKKELRNIEAKMNKLYAILYIFEST